MVCDRQEASYSSYPGQEFEDTSVQEQEWSRQEDDDALASSATNSTRQLLDKGKQIAHIHAYLNPYFHHYFPFKPLPDGTSSGNAETRAKVWPSTLSNSQIVTSDPLMAASMSRDRKRDEAATSTFIGIHMPQYHARNVREKRKAKYSTAIIESNLNRKKPYLPEGTEMIAEAPQPFFEEGSYYLYSNQLKQQPCSINSSNNWNSVEQTTSASNAGDNPLLFTGHNLFQKASTSQAIPKEIQGKDQMTGIVSILWTNR